MNTPLNNTRENRTIVLPTQSVAEAIHLLQTDVYNQFEKVYLDTPSIEGLVSFIKVNHQWMMETQKQESVVA